MGKWTKLAALIAMLALSAALFAGCGGSTKTGGEAKKGGKVTLTLWHYYELPPQQKALNEVAQKFNSSQDKITIKMEFLPRNELTKQLSIGMVANKLPDLVFLDNPDTPSFAAMGLLADITDKVNSPDVKKDAYYPGPLKSNTVNGKYYGIPLGSNCVALFYNIDMLKAAGITPPSTWDELRADAKKLTKDGTYGFAMSGIKNEEGTFQMLPWILSPGASFDRLDSAEGIKGFQFVTDLINDGSLSKECINWTQTDVEKQFATGKTAMMENGPWQLPVIKADAPNLKYGVVLLPKDKQYASVLGGENLSIIKGHHEAEAWEFVKFLMKPENLNPILDSIGYIPSRKDWAEGSAKLNSDPIMKVFVEEMKYAMPRGPEPKWPEVSEAIYTAMQECFTNQMKPEQAAKAAEAKVSNVLK
ncbi:Hypothetical protein LUCI_0948 [Lucifera butyrica]|uniref:Bacterial extracellular solute-binding protein n=1 Tax=Lucifera butyrica TaxID=1351585 RepID=A0A498R4I6_9FIRM|nr:ABC transporter substrate-binding protein [Lucifera butyrica]VBB05737.1 Hypothetical protein LUCI_0948 [Lucifera butyrica]